MGELVFGGVNNCNEGGVWDEIEGLGSTFVSSICIALCSI